MRIRFRIHNTALTDASDSVRKQVHNILPMVGFVDIKSSTGIIVQVVLTGAISTLPNGFVWCFSKGSLLD
jgi:hypothetical protein